jgi:uncharacterized protein YkwD
MHRWDRLRTWALMTALLTAVVRTPARADALAEVQVLRAGGCGGIVPIAPPLQHSATLDKVAEQWAAGAPLTELTTRIALGPKAAAGVHVTASGPALLEQLRRGECRTVTARNFTQIGAFRRGADTWLVLAGTASASAPGAMQAQVPAAVPAPTVAPAAAAVRSTPALTSAAHPGSSPTAVLSTRALTLVNEARARGTRCGSRAFAPAPPLTLSGTLDSVAYGHATDMAQHNYFEHQDLSGQSPADRVRAVGFSEKLVGENIAYGPETVDEVVQGWLNSPDHCENIMDPRFAEMGLAFASGRGTRHGLYWVQLLVQPRSS